MKRGADLMEKYKNIPAGIDILVTHGPPLGQLDFTTNEVNISNEQIVNSNSLWPRAVSDFGENIVILFRSTKHL